MLSELRDVIYSGAVSIALLSLMNQLSRDRTYLISGRCASVIEVEAEAERESSQRS